MTRWCPKETIPFPTEQSTEAIKREENTFRAMKEGVTVTLKLDLVKEHCRFRAVMWRLINHITTIEKK